MTDTHHTAPNALARFIACTALTRAELQSGALELHVATLDDMLWIVDCYRHGVPDALRTRTKPTDSDAATDSAVTLWREVDALGGAADDPIGLAYTTAIGDVLEILERRGFSEQVDPAARFVALVDRIANWTDSELEHVDARQTRHIAQVVKSGADPQYPPFPPNDSGKSACQRTDARFVDADGYATSETPHGADKDGTWRGIPLERTDSAVLGIDCPEPAHPPTFGGKAVTDLSFAEALTEVDRLRGLLAAKEPADANGPIAPARAMTNAVDPSPEEQRARFEAIGRQPRPSAVAIKAALERMEEIIGWVLSVDRPNANTIGFDLRAMAGMIDKLAVDLLATEMDRDEAHAQLQRIADQAKPIDDTDMAELVQNARKTAERIRANPAKGAPSIRPGHTADLLDALCATLNDQARRLAEAVQMGSGGAVEGDVVAKAYAVLVGWIQHGKDPGSANWSALASEMRWALIEATRELETVKAERGKSRLYGEKEERAARNAVFERYYLGGSAVQTTPVQTRELVTIVAKALGMERIG